MKKGNRRQIGIFGGSFDPIHLGHMGLAQETYNKFGLDQIVFVPVFQSPHKPLVPSASNVQRVEMLRLALKDNTNFSISDADLRREQLSYTIDTLNSCNLKFPDSELFLIIGYDNLLDLDSWKDSRKIMARCNILVASRPIKKSFSPEDKVFGLFNGDSPYRLSKKENGMQKFIHHETGNRLIVFSISPRDISSSAVREKLAHGKPTKNLLPPQVEAYIIRRHIYQTKTQHSTR